MADAWDIGRGVSGYQWRAPEARASLLLQHGFAEYAERYVTRYSQLIPKLNALGLDVYAFDARGHGRSPGERGVADLKQTVADHRAARALLVQQGKPVFLFGHSLGGLVTAASVAEDQDNVAGVVLSAPALLISAPAHLRAIAGIVATFAPGARLAPPLPVEGLSRIPDEIAAYQGDPMVSDPRVPARTGATAIAVAEQAWTRYPQWRTPVLVLHGGADTATDPEGSKRFFGLIASSDKQLEFYPEGRHELLNDLERDKALEATLSWLRTRL